MSVLSVPPFVAQAFVDSTVITRVVVEHEARVNLDHRVQTGSFADSHCFSGVGVATSVVNLAERAFGTVFLGVVFDRYS